MPEGSAVQDDPHTTAELAQGGVSFPDESGEHWLSVHWLTPLIKSWQVVVIGGAAVAHNVATNLLQGEEALAKVRQFFPNMHVWLVGLAAILATLIVVGLLSYVSWRMTRFRMTAEAIELRTGVIFRQHRIAQLDRLQAVDVVQPFLARVVGLSKLSIEVAGGAGSAIQLAYLKESDAQKLRNHILAAAAGLDFAPGFAPEAPEHNWLEVPVRRLVSSILLSSSTLVLVGLAIGSMVFAAYDRSIESLFFTAPALLGAVGSAWARFSSGFGFRVAVSPDGLRLRHGLIETRQQTVPPGRVQAIQVKQPLMWRLAGWWRLDVNVAGYASAGNESHTESVLLPVASRDDVLAVLAFIVPDLGLAEGEDTVTLVDAALNGSGNAAGFVTSPRRARWLDWFSWQRNGFRVTETVLLIRLHWANRATIVVPHARTQSMAVTQGPIMRRLDLARFELHSTPGPVHPQIPHLSTTVAAQLLHAQSERARHARSVSGPERWMRVSLPPLGATSPE